MSTPVEPTPHLVQLYTTAMLAELVGVKPAVLRRWVKRRWLVPTCEVRRLAYFDFEEVATARRLAELVSAGASTADIERHLAALTRAVPHVRRPLAQLPLVVEGRHLLVRREECLSEPDGQLRFEFSLSPDEQSQTPAVDHLDDNHATVPMASLRMGDRLATDPHQLVLLAEDLQDEGRLTEAAETLRAALAAGGPQPEVCFLLAEVLYQLGDLSAARERYHMAIEMDEDYVEARANLGCLLAELGEHELAVAALEGALAFHAEYADVHYHLARTLDELGRTAAADNHWRIFLQLSPESPWADEARLRLAEPVVN
jgi:tetratricopeptide (TPR) repeat protein